MRWIIFLSVLLYVHCDELLVAEPTTPIASRIIGGSPTTIEQYPFMVQVAYSGSLLCGGTILTSRIILSAAHCFVSSNGVTISPVYYTIRAGTTNLNAGGTTRSVSAIIVHEFYNQPVRDNDIALVILSTVLQFGTTIQAAYIPPQGYELVDNASLIHAGWGTTSTQVQTLASVLNHVTVLSINRTVCAARYQYLQNVTGYPYPVTTNMICSGLLDIGGADACQGDSGGPLLASNVVVGITSWGMGCAEAFYPGVNARVSSYTNWINATVARYNGGPSINNVNAALMLITSMISLSCLWKM